MPPSLRTASGRASEEQQEGAPGLHLATRMNRQLTDQMVVQQRRQLGDRWIRARCRLAVDEQSVGEDPNPQGLGEAAGGGQADDPAEGGGNGRMGSGIQDDGACRGLEGARELGQPGRILRGERGGRFHGHWVNYLIQGARLGARDSAREQRT